MSTRDRLRAADLWFWVFLVATVVAVVAGVLSLVDPQWIERLFEVSPDEGSGEAEWWMTAVAGAVAVGSLLTTRWRWRSTLPRDSHAAA